MFRGAIKEPDTTKMLNARYFDPCGLDWETSLSRKPQYAHLTQPPRVPLIVSTSPVDPAVKLVLSDPSKKIPVYSGGPELEDFLRSVQEVSEEECWADAKTVDTIRLKFRGRVEQRFYSCRVIERPATVTSMIAWLRAEFGKEELPQSPTQVDVTTLSTFSVVVGQHPDLEETQDQPQRAVVTSRPTLPIQQPAPIKGRLSDSTSSVENLIQRMNSMELTSSLLSIDEQSKPEEVRILTPGSTELVDAVLAVPLASAATTVEEVPTLSLKSRLRFRRTVKLLSNLNRMQEVHVTFGRINVRYPRKNATLDKITTPQESKQHRISTGTRKDQDDPVFIAHSLVLCAVMCRSVPCYN